MKKRNDLYNLGNDYNQKNVFNGTYSDGIYHNILNPIKMNQRTLNIVQKDWEKDDNGYIFSKDYATAKLTDNTHFKIADNNEYFKDESIPDKLKWYSECNAKGYYSDGSSYDLHQGLDYSEYDKMKNIMIKLYDKDEITKRNAKNTWQTVHSTIYDLDKKKLLICVQEQDKTILLKI